MKELVEDIVIPDDQKHYFTDQDLGWYHSQKEVESEKEYTERVRDLLKDFRQMEQKDIHTDKTYVVISHGQLLMRMMLSNINVSSSDAESENMIPANNSLTIIDFKSQHIEKTNQNLVEMQLNAFNLQLIDGTSSTVFKDENAT